MWETYRDVSGLVVGELGPECLGFGGEALVSEFGFPSCYEDTEMNPSSAPHDDGESETKPSPKGRRKGAFRISTRLQGFTAGFSNSFSLTILLSLRQISPCHRPKDPLSSLPSFLGSFLFNSHSRPFLTRTQRPLNSRSHQLRSRPSALSPYQVPTAVGDDPSALRSPIRGCFNP
jgi:hypothetical protein